uniref:Uncharacterized protein n=1 Tax=Dulem virus 35 TaxID=3145753 RepID=A0AAU8AYM0_9CAUD
MGIRDKDYQARLAGMDYAYKIAKAQGLEVLEKDLKLRKAYGMGFL